MRVYPAPYFKTGTASAGRLSPAGRSRRGYDSRILRIRYPSAQPGAASRERGGGFHRPGRPSRGAELAAAVAVSLLFAACGAVWFCSGVLCVPDGVFYPNICVQGVDVGGKTMEQAQALFSGQGGLPDLGVALDLDGTEHTVSAVDVGARYNIQETLDAAMALCRAGGWIERLDEALALRKAPRNFTFTATYDDALLREAAERIARESSLPATNAALQFLPDTGGVFAYAGESPGRAVDADELYNLMKAALDRGGHPSLSAVSAQVPAEVTAAALKDRTQLLGTYTTALKPDTVRSKNIGLAGDAVNGAVIFPGDTFSFNGRTGERTKQKGYVDAPAISSGLIVDAPGGGVCQVSSTVYNAALLAGLEVVERHHHTWPVSYVPAGFDATVDWGNKDLQIRNNTNEPVYLIFHVDADKGLATAEFYGLPQADAIAVESGEYEVLMPEKPLKFSNSNRPIGWSRDIVKARNGCRVNVYRTVTRAGQAVRELLYTDTYPTLRGQLEIGTKPDEKKEK